MSEETKAKPTKKAKPVPVTTPQVDLVEVTLQPETVVPKKKTYQVVQGAKVLEIPGVGCVVNLEGSSAFVPGVRVLGDNLVAIKR